MLLSSDFFTDVPGALSAPPSGAKDRMTKVTERDGCPLFPMVV